jgi:TonB family protein
MAHALLLIWILFPVTPIYIRPSAILAGRGGTRTTYVTFAPKSNSKITLPEELMNDNPRVTWQKPAKKIKKQDPKTLSRTPQELHASAAAPSNEAPAGSPYGSLSYGATEGSEVRPAIRISGSEPRVFPWDLANVSEGNIIVEVTIDERGNIIRKQVLQSLAPVIDNKVMAALEDWRFLPATRDGVAIPSKQDVYYHYPVRR